MQRTCKSKFQDWIGLFWEKFVSRISSVGGTPTDSHDLGGPIQVSVDRQGFHTPTEHEGRPHVDQVSGEHYVQG